MSLPTVDLAYGALGLAVIALIFGIWGLAAASRVKRRYLRVFGDEKPQNVEALIAALHERVDAAVDRFDAFGARLDTVETKAGQAINRVGLVRFNPFMDTGSDLSFSAALLNDHGDGLVLTSLWGRDEVRLYAKPVESHESRYVLSQEEKQALDMARNVRGSQPIASKSQA
ncbi:DUF4446 family protein [Sulfobacillus sp. DSM 109850]|uniref:DUF4446 family protein n=1 Tax=Sulfobacillus harzensis TaxID=2729629 RepID=A0A7Y0Q1K4_9FIRM|nr:DUF4446 family protein [Sulfobacillus harzensis]